MSADEEGLSPFTTFLPLHSKKFIKYEKLGGAGETPSD